MKTKATPLITVVVPSLNQAQFLDRTLHSILQQSIAVEVYVMDGGSTDGSVEIIKKWEHKLAGWRSHPDDGQAAAINEGIAKGSAEFVCWLNSDDFFYPKGLEALSHSLTLNESASSVYGQCWTVTVSDKKLIPYITLPFSPYLFANFCFIAQPATLIRRSAWEAVGGLNEDMYLAFDYELWWKLYVAFGKPHYLRSFVAATRAHKDTKTANNTNLHYQESSDTVRKYYGKVPVKWLAGAPLMKVIRTLFRI